MSTSDDLSAVRDATERALSAKYRGEALGEAYAAVEAVLADLRARLAEACEDHGVGAKKATRLRTECDGVHKALAALRPLMDGPTD